MSRPRQSDSRFTNTEWETHVRLTNVTTQNYNTSSQCTTLTSSHDLAQFQNRSIKPLQTFSEYKSTQSDEAFRPDIGFQKSEEYESLPSYSCSVYKMGYVIVKQDMNGAGVRSRKRSWRMRYLVLWGTSLSLYYSECDHSEKKPPFLNFTLQNAKAEPALDYIKRPSVIRLKICQGPHFLMRTNNSYEITLWLEHLRAAINISLDLDQRAMPNFRTFPLRRPTAVIPLYQQILQEFQDGIVTEMTIRPDLDYAMAVAFSPVDDDQGVNFAIIWE